MEMENVFSEISLRMKKSIDLLEKNYTEIRAGRANPSILDKVLVDYYGTPTPINQIASVSISEARVLVIQPWDVSMVSVIEKAIQKSDIGINPQSDGKVIRLVFPQLNEEMRENIVKDISKMAENSKVSVRSLRRDAMDKLKNLKKNSEITEDDLKYGEKKVQEVKDKYIDQIDLLLKSKSDEVMTI